METEVSNQLLARICCFSFENKNDNYSLGRIRTIVDE